MILIVNSMLILCAWILAAALLLFLYLIGRFYERKFGQRSHYQLFLVPLVLFLIAALWYTIAAGGGVVEWGDFVGLFWSDLLYLLGGLCLLVLSYGLYRAMMGGQR